MHAVECSSRCSLNLNWCVCVFWNKFESFENAISQGFVSLPSNNNWGGFCFGAINLNHKSFVVESRNEI